MPMFDIYMVDLAMETVIPGALVQFAVTLSPPCFHDSQNNV